MLGSELKDSGSITVHPYAPSTPSSKMPTPLLHTIPYHFLTQLGMWYFFSVMYNVELKALFKTYDFPIFFTFANLFVAALGSASAMPRSAASSMEPSVMMRKLFFVGLLQFLGTLSTNLSISAMAVSFTHIVKAVEPVFTLGWIYVLMSTGYMAHSGAIITRAQLAAVIVVVIGVILASISESTFTFYGFFFGLVSNVSFAGRNVLLKSVMSNYKVGKEQLFLFSSILGCAVCLIPLTLFESSALGALSTKAYVSLFYVSVMYFLYNLVSFSVLDGVPAVSHAIANCCKRLVIVFSSLFVFHIIPSETSIIGSLITIFGVASYSVLKTIQSQASNLTMRTFKKLLVGFLVSGIILFYLLKSAIPLSVEVQPKLNVYSPIFTTQWARERFSAAEIQVFGPRQPGVDPFGNSELIASLQKKIVDGLSPFFEGKNEAIYLEIPDHNNRGDNCLYVGSKAFLDLINIRVVHECAHNRKFECDMKTIRSHIHPNGKTMVVWQPGGNFGDLYTSYNKLRALYAKTMPDQRTILLPQSVLFSKKEGWKKAQSDLGVVKEGLLTLATRDQFSYDEMREHFPTRNVVLVPDIAFMMGHKTRPAKPIVDFLLLIRRDKESVLKGNNLTFDSVPKEITYQRVDWHDEVAPDIEKAATIGVKNLERCYNGLAMLSRGKVVITDRLHAHILSTLMDIPHVILDNSYYKVHGSHDLWTTTAKGVEKATNWEEALQKGLKLLAQVNYYNYNI